MRHVHFNNVTLLKAVRDKSGVHNHAFCQSVTYDTIGNTVGKTSMLS